MAFRFQWPYFSEEFIQEAKTMLTNALNKGNKPAVIVDHITVKELDMGTLPPDLEMLEMGELSMERFRGIFKLTYNGDAHIVLQTKVQANPMNVKKTDNPSYTRRGILAADQPLVVPMLLRISDFKLRGIIVLVVDQIKGITLVFKNDPLESVLVSSTFDSITPIQKFLQSEIEKQLRNLFQEDLPTAIHNLSQQFTKKPEEVSRQQSQDDLHGRPGIYDGGLGTPMVSQNPSRRSSMLPKAKKTPGRTNSEPDMSAGPHYDDDRLNGTYRKPASATVRSESPGSGPRDPHTEYTGEAHRDLLQESLEHPSNNPAVGRLSSRNSSRRPSHSSDRHDNSAAAASTLDRLSSLGIAESTHLANQFANLIHSNQTISPYAQNLDHFAFRSVPPKRPVSVQYYANGSNYGSQSPVNRSGPGSATGVGLSKDALDNLHRKPGHPNHSPQLRHEYGGQSSPRISHRRLQGRVGIRRYAMQMGGGNGPRELSDQESDEYNDVDEALSENEYVYVEKFGRPSTDLNRGEFAESISKPKSSFPPDVLPEMRTAAELASPLSRPQLSLRRSPRQTSLDNPYNIATMSMPGGFTTGVDARSWSGTKNHTDDYSRIETRSVSSSSTLSPETALNREMASMQLNGKVRTSPSNSLSSSSSASPNIPVQNHGQTLKTPAIPTARTFSNTQRYSQPSLRLPPPAPLKRDKRNSSILSSRRVSSVGIGLGVLSKDGDKKGLQKMTSTSQEQQPLERPSLYKTGKPFNNSQSGWFELDTST
ncbi:mitochondrial distribution and morphology protein 34 [Entomortierella parvispora]|uniref:Mitochondrial distribution and morphology protein 34 n=1 Tax=Entomortierella parvispora TaxID=205924 RepID=A0A9P3LS53_9FUNG|nr:mitochondrial distribution and morphology protein 34 [Entomortierella parvispora]